MERAIKDCNIRYFSSILRFLHFSLASSHAISESNVFHLNDADIYFVCFSPYAQLHSLYQTAAAKSRYLFCRRWKLVARQMVWYDNDFHVIALPMTWYDMVCVQCTRSVVQMDNSTQMLKPAEVKPLIRYVGNVCSRCRVLQGIIFFHLDAICIACINRFL